MDMREHAVAIAKRGYRVLPLHWPIMNALTDYERGACSCKSDDCKSIGKHPLNKDGSRGATSDLIQITAWWDRWPNANIGIATGHNVDVVDIDSDEGQALFDDYVKRFGMPKHLEYVATGRGAHYYVTPGGMQSWTGGYGGHPKGLDVKGRGGYVVAPPSLHESGKRYQWVMGSAEVMGSADWPEWHTSVCSLYAGTPTTPGDSDELRIAQPRSTSGKGFAATVKADIERVCLSAPEGTRWQTFNLNGTWRCAGLIKGGEISEDEALELLEDVATQMGLDHREIGRIPGELRRAIASRRDPIKGRGTSEGVPATTAGTDSGLSVDLAGLDYEAELARRVALKKIDLQVYERAKNELRQEALADQRRATGVKLPDLLAEPIEPVRYRIENLWPIGGRAMLAAQFKAGKTTLVGNALRALADNQRFLSKYQANQPTGSIALFDTEMSKNMLQSWLRDQAIANPDKIWLMPMRGLCGSFDLTDDMVRAQWAQELKDEDTEILILDCLGPVLAALGMDENNNQDVGKFIGAFEALLSEADVREALIVHHMGHSNERSRGASRLRDWPDVEWQLIREGQEDEQAPEASAPRYFKAFGRDVFAPEQLLQYDNTFRWLSVNGHGNRAEVKVSRKGEEITEIVKANPGISGRGIEIAVRGKAENIRIAIKGLIAAGTLRAVQGPRNATLYFHCDYQAT